MKGIFKPKNKQKYIGNPDNIIYRSSWELSFMNFIDRADVVLKWASEEISFKYYLITDKRWHRYFPDFYLELITGDKFIIEIKSVDALNDIHLAQILTYLKLADCKLGMLINFNVVLLKNGVKRVINGQL